MAFNWFQFHKGTIRTFCVYRSAVAFLFQFHKGTIRTSRRPWHAFASGYFNSIKVRLEPPVGAANSRRPSAFQFHKGTIRTYKQIIEELKDTNFNSIKVRLERASALFPTPTIKFQFHKGTIRTQFFLFRLL